ncbi:MAG: hypothetical protein ABL908_05600 [Hyphomicrobium sp.]
MSASPKIVDIRTRAPFTAPPEPEPEIKPTISVASVQMVRELEEALQLAKDGKVTSILLSYAYGDGTPGYAIAGEYLDQAPILIGTMEVSKARLSAEYIASKS